MISNSLPLLNYPFKCRIRVKLFYLRLTQPLVLSVTATYMYVEVLLPYLLNYILNAGWTRKITADECRHTILLHDYL